MPRPLENRNDFPRETLLQALLEHLTFPLAENGSRAIEEIQ